MAVTADADYPREIHPFHAVLLAGTLPLFLGALLSDIAYARSYHIQWNNFASWLIAGALVFGAAALICALIELLRADRRSTRHGLYVLLLIATWVLGFINALIHAKDAWASMPTGLVLSVIVFVLACLSVWAGVASPHRGVTP